MQRKQTLSLKLQVGQPAYNLKFVSVYENKKGLVAVLELTPKIDPNGGTCAIQITAYVEASMDVDKADLKSKPVKYYVIADEDACWIKRSDKFSIISDIEKIKSSTSKMREIFTQAEKLEATESSFKKHRK